MPSDSLIRDQWHLDNKGKHGGLKGEDIGAFTAWKTQNKSPNVVVAVIDGGVDLTHPDLKNNVWLNGSEIPQNGIDDDGNGYVDDVSGWNFVIDNESVVPDDHGTHVAGIIGAEGDNSVGVAGVTWDVQIMSLDIFSGQTKFSNDNLLDAIYYAVDNGADIINMSIGYTIPHANLSAYKRLNPDAYYDYLEAFKYAVSNDVMIISSAGNDSSDDQNSLSLPSAFGSIVPGFMTVAALDNYAYLTDYSNYGSKVSIAAPGGSTEEDWCGRRKCSKKAQIISTVTGGKYGGMPGTSMASPVVSGSAALIIEAGDSLAPADIEEILQISGNNSYDFDSYVMHGKQLDLNSGLKLVKKWDKLGINEILMSPEEYVYSGTNQIDHFRVDFDSGKSFDKSFKIDSFSPKSDDYDLDSLIFAADTVTAEQLDEIYFESVFNIDQLDQAKISETTFVYHKPSGALYLNNNGTDPGWSSNNNDSPLIELVDGPELLADNIKVFIDQYEYRIPSIIDNSGSSIPYAMHADEHTASHLWDASGKDGVINYFIDVKGVYGKHDKMPKGSEKFITQALQSIDENTSLVLQESKMKDADFILGSVKKYKHAHYNYKKWGGSSAWIMHKKRGSGKMTVQDKVGVCEEIGNALGLVLSGKSEGVYDFTDSVMAYDYNYKNFNGFTQTDFITIDRIWTSLS